MTCVPAHRDGGAGGGAPAGPAWGRFAELHPAEMGAILEQAPVAWVSSGTLEWHCHHLPLGLGGLLAEALCERTAARAGGVMVPPTYWAIGGVPYPYTTRVEPSVVEALFVSVFEQLCQVGFRFLRLQLRILEIIRRDRAMLPPSQVRSLMSEPYVRSLDFAWRGNHARAREAAQEAYTLLAQRGADLGQ